MFEQLAITNSDRSLEIFDLRTDPGGEGARIEGTNGGHAAAARTQVRPGGGRIVTDGRHHANARNGNSPARGHARSSGASPTRTPLMTRFPLRASTLMVAAWGES